ncbi:MAG: hypothetical protein ACO34E_18075 [Limisphaerales bacterium]
MRWERLLWMVLMVVIAGPVWGHRLSVDWEVRAGELVVRAGSEGEPASGADMELRTGGGELVGMGRSDDLGGWTCRLQQAGDYALVVDAGLGHRRSVSIHVAAEVLAGGGEAGRGQAGTEMNGGDAGEVAATKGSTESGPGLGWRAALGVTLIFLLAGGWMRWNRDRNGLPGRSP